MGRLVVIEGLDGAGKNTLATRLTAQWQQEGQRVATLSFPRYGQSIHADLIRDVLYGRVGDLGDSVYGAALLFALDRREAADDIRGLLQSHDVVLLDRYISSNAAYGAARLGAPDRPTDFPDWVRELEIDRFDEPVPDHQLLLAPPPQVAANRARSRAADSVGRALDAFESDTDLQQRTAQMYAVLAADEFLSPWTVLTPGADGAVAIPESV